MHRQNKLLALLVFAIALVSVAACSDDPIAPDVSAREVGVVVTSTDLALTIFDVDDPGVSETVGLGADGSPVGVAIRGRYAAVPMGIVPAVAVVDLDDPALVRTVALPEGSGATGIAFLNDSIALVANPELGSVTPVNVRAGTTGAEIEVGRYPQGVVVRNGRAYVLNAELESFQPAGPSTITVIDAASLSVLDTIELSGENAAGGALGPDGRLYVIHSGSFGVDDGALSIVDLGTGAEVDFVEGFGGFPGSIAVDEAGLVYVGAFGVGMLVWDSATGAFVRGLDDPVTPGGVASTSGVAFDASGRVYALEADCQNPAVAHRLTSTFESEREIPVGICPIAVAFAEIEDEG